MTMALPAPESELKKILEGLRKSDERVPSEILSLLDHPITHNDENGFRKWCAACADTTGHLIVPTRAWQIERCMRCGLVTRYAALRASRGSGHRSLLVRPDLTAQDVFVHRLQVYGLEHELWALDQYIEGKAKELVREALEKRMRERKSLAEFSRL